MKKKIFIVSFIFFILILLVFFYLLIIERNPTELPSNLLNKNVPKFEADSLIKKEKFISSEEFGNEIVLVNFFATWCRPCLEEHNYIKRFSNEEKIRIIGINYKDNKKAAINWLSKLGNPYSKILLDRDGTLAIEWGAYGVPETFLIYDHQILKRYIGPLNTKLITEIENLIK